jgi:glycogen debranching enzyme
VEVQGYVVAAFEVMARLHRRRGHAKSAHELRQRAQALRERINEAFWMEDVGYYALALDGAGGRVPTISSNPGHLALCRAVPAERMQALAETLLSDEMYSGWGIRTLARGQAVFNPLSYHNGTVWPHDNALCALGLALGGQVDEAVRICEGLYAAALQFRDLRLPELFCGMSRGRDELLVHYPVSCAPQAWASGAFFLLLQAALGIQPDATLGRLVIRNPRLPSFLHTLDLEGMRVGRTAVTLHFERHGARTHVDLIDVVGDGRLKVNIEMG